MAAWLSFDTLGGTIGNDSDILVARSSDAGATWSAPAALNVGAASDFTIDEMPDLRTDGSGVWVAVWSTEDLGQPRQITSSRSIDAGLTWSAQAALTASPGSDTEPRLDTDGSGNWVAVWESTEDVGGAIGVDPDVLAATSSDGGVSWATPVVLNGNATSDPNFGGLGLAFPAAIASDGAGVWIAGWHSFDGLGDTLGADADLLMARSTDVGATWSFPEALNTNAASFVGEDSHPDLATDGAGTWVAVWQVDPTDGLGGLPGVDDDLDLLVARLHRRRGHLDGSPDLEHQCPQRLRP